MQRKKVDEQIPGILPYILLGGRAGAWQILLLPATSSTPLALEFNGML
jgi:hypothetical protein